MGEPPGFRAKLVRIVHSMNDQDRITQFLAGAPHAVVGASRDRSKIGNAVLRAYVQHKRPVYPVNPSAREVEGHLCYPDLAAISTPIHGVSVITQPHVSEQIVEQAGAIGVKNMWFQPGAESRRALERAQELGMNVIALGPCILVVLGFSDRR